MTNIGDYFETANGHFYQVVPDCNHSIRNCCCSNPTKCAVPYSKSIVAKILATGSTASTASTSSSSTTASGSVPPASHATKVKTKEGEEEQQQQQQGNGLKSYNKAHPVALAWLGYGKK